MKPAVPRTWIRPTLGAAALGALIAVPLLTFATSRAEASDVRLEPFRTCEDVVSAARRRALDALSSGGGWAIPLAAAEDTTGGAAQSSARTAGTDFSATNVQEAGIDEPDIVKTDGDRTFAIAQGKVYALDTSGAEVRLAGSVALPDTMYAQDMLLSGNRLLVIANQPMPIDGIGGGPEIFMPTRFGSTLIEIDVTDMTAMRVGDRLEVDGSYVTARQSGTAVRVVLTSNPLMTIGQNAASEADYRAAIQAAGVEDFIPGYRLTSADGGTSSGSLVACANVSSPRDASGAGMVTLLTLDLGSGIRPVDSDAVMAEGWTVMASARRVYVALSRTDTEDSTLVAKTEVHAFDTSEARQTTYTASGLVTGNLLNQFSMSEYEGRLRVATTLESYSVTPMPEPAPGGVDDSKVSPGSDGSTEPGSGASEPPSTGGGTDGDAISSDDTDTSDTTPPPSGGDAPVSIVPAQGATESAVTVLEERGDELRQVGRVAGLGRGERIYAVRFIGRTGYVVTFRQTDPLYTIDLSDPTRPRVAGELKIPGYSSYLHPVDDTTLIGVGQNVTTTRDGKITQVQGLQVGLFDVADPANPRRVQAWTMPGAVSDAEWDHHAFLWWPATSTVVLPLTGAVTVTSPDVREFAIQSRAVALRVTRDGITRTGTIAHPQSDQTQIRRTVVIGDQLLTFSDAGVGVSTLDGATRRQWVPFS